jgi:RHS Repeat.
MILTVKTPDNKVTTFHYTGGNLTSITYPDNKTTQYAYDTSNQLQKATNVDNSYVQ